MRKLWIPFIVALAVSLIVPVAFAFSIPWGTSKVTWNPVGGYPVTSNLRYAQHRNFDRVVIDINGHIPGGHAGYVRQLVFDGSGATVPLRGRHKFSVVLTPARAHSLNGPGLNLYNGPRLRQVDMPMLRGVAFIGDYEGYVSFGFTTRERAPFRVFSLHHPQRIVLDFHH